jgi:hypothetical protein
MAGTSPGTSPRLPEQYHHQDVEITDFHVNELLADHAGSLSPYGEDANFPLPLNKVNYTHPTAADRPNLADGR